MHCKSSAKSCSVKNNTRTIFFGDTTIIAYEIDKLRLQILEALHIKAKQKLRLIELILKISTML